MDIVKELSYLNSFPDFLAENKVTLTIQSTIACPWLFMASLIIPISHFFGSQMCSGYSGQMFEIVRTAGGLNPKSKCIGNLEFCEWER